VFMPRRKHDAKNRKCGTDSVLSAFNEDDVIDTDVNEMLHRQRADLTSVRRCQ